MILSRFSHFIYAYIVIISLPVWLDLAINNEKLKTSLSHSNRNNITHHNRHHLLCPPKIVCCCWEPVLNIQHHTTHTHLHYISSLHRVSSTASSSSSETEHSASWRCLQLFLCPLIPRPDCTGGIIFKLNVISIKPSMISGDHVSGLNGGQLLLSL